MKCSPLLSFIITTFLSVTAPLLNAAGPSVREPDLSELPAWQKIPPPLQPWASWALWDTELLDSPTPYSNGKEALPFWPSQLALKIDDHGGRFDLGVTVFHPCWVPLPGKGDLWPASVRVDDAPVPVLEHAEGPSVFLRAGQHRVTGEYPWSEIPKGLPLPRAIGVVTLVLNGQPVAAPVWDAEGFLWLKRDGLSTEADRDFFSKKISAVFEDGIPLWWRSDVELTVSGKSREEELGAVLPQGWKLVSVESALPVAIDDSGGMKVQVRAGKWTVHLDALRFDNPQEFRYSPDKKLAAAETLVAFRARPDFRLVEISGATSVDVSQISFPEKWRSLPVYRWDTAIPLHLQERLRGMGLQKPAGLSIARELWLDENGAGLTFRDQITGARQQIWRLDGAEGSELGSARSAGQGQLITRNPANGAAGVEIRTPSIDLEATGRLARARNFSATGWRTDADQVQVALHLPPGWRLFALFGADWVSGDWLTSWTLLDLFLLLVFSLAVFRMCGWKTALLAFFAFGLPYHEYDAPRWIWLILLVPIVLLRLVEKEGWTRRLLTVAKFATAFVFLLLATPFCARQIQQALYPQLETKFSYGNGRDSDAEDAVQVFTDSRQLDNGTENPKPSTPEQQNQFSISSNATGSRWASKTQVTQKENLLYDSKARIQTGPGVPEWTWRAVRFGWNGPVQAGQQVEPIFIPLWAGRCLSLARVALILGLASILLGARKFSEHLIGPRLSPLSATALAVLFSLGISAPTHAQVPSDVTLDLLRKRLLEPADAFPHAADLPQVSLSLEKSRILIDVEVHAAVRTAVPLPGKFPTWSPLSVQLDGAPEVALRRADGYLWIVIPAGVHHVHVEGQLATVTEWEWTFLLRPRRVTIAAPDWTFNGVRPDGVPEQQVFFAVKQKSASAAASYDHQDLQSLASVEREIEFGLVWQVRTTVNRLSPVGKAIALRIPLLPGENVFTANTLVRDGQIEIRLGANETTTSWESGLTASDHLQLQTNPTDPWIERWRLIASPIWNVGLAGLPPIFTEENAELTPTWQPWPGEHVELTISRPEALAGATITVHHGSHQTTVGQRQRLTKLQLSVQCSLGEDFPIDLPPGAEVTELSQDGHQIPVRVDGTRLVIPLHPGTQEIGIQWKMNTPLSTKTTGATVRLPVEIANLQTTMRVPENRWVLWTSGPRRGPAVRFWPLLAIALLIGGILGRLATSPLPTRSWILLLIGLTQVPLIPAMLVVSWFFLLGWRAREPAQKLRAVAFAFLQLALLALTLVMLGTLIEAVSKGLLGQPEMFISGNGSTGTLLHWYQARSEALLPQPSFLSISIWWYRFLMLAWALWLAVSLLKWLSWAWKNFTAGGLWKPVSLSRKVLVPDLPKAPAQPSAR